MSVLEKAKSAVQTVFGVEVEDARIEAVDAERVAIYESILGSRENIHALVGSVDGSVREFVFGVGNGGNVEVPNVSCQITYEDLSLAECVEFCFADESPYPQWHLAQISTLAVDDFKAKKFKLWEHQLKEPECEAAFRRLLQQGPIRHVYDKFIFPSPDSVASNYKVIDEHSGKVVDIPHQVERMRVWDAQSRKYVDFDPSLVGAPKTQSDADKYWKEFLAELRTLRGAEYIDSLLGI